MDKKAAIILLSASLAFILATGILLKGVGTTDVLGISQMSLSSLQKEGDLYLAYIDNAAKFALAETIKIIPSESKDFYTICKTDIATCNTITEYFGKSFEKHLASFNKAYGQKLDLKNYKFYSKLIVSGNKLEIEFLGVSTDYVEIKKGEDITYKVKPNFKIRADLEDLNKLATTKEIIAVTFFNELVDKFQNCLNYNKKGLDNCFCDKSEINPGELPDDYKISIITTAEKDKLLGGVEYYFKLFYKGDSVTYSEKPQVRTLKYIIGAYEYVRKDVEDKLCYPGAISKTSSMTFDKNSEKGKLYSFLGDANCKGVSQFGMVEFVKESDFGKFTKSECSKIGVKAS